MLGRAPYNGYTLDALVNTIASEMKQKLKAVEEEIKKRFDSVQFSKL